MRKLIYTILDQNYLPLFATWVNHIKLYNPFIDIAVICPTELIIPEEHARYVEVLRSMNFDYRYYSKYTIFDYDINSYYTDFLYLDLDVICIKPLDEIFHTIHINSDKIHCRTEAKVLMDAQEYHKFNKNTIVDIDLAGFNAGTFGFNVACKSRIIKFIKFIDENKHQAICDQPLFNMFFSVQRETLPTLDHYVWLDGWDNSLAEEFYLLHYLGNYGKISNKISRISTKHSLK